MEIAILFKSFGKNMKEAAKITTLSMSSQFNKVGHKTVIISDRGFERSNSKIRTKAYEKIEGVEVFRPYYLKNFLRFDLSPMNIFNRFISQPMGTYYVEKNKKIKFNIICSVSSAPILVLNNLFFNFFNKKIVRVHILKSYSMDFFGSLKFSFLLKGVDKVIVPLNDMKSKLISCGLRKDNIEVIKSPVRLEKFKPSSKILLKKKYGYSKKKIILYYGHSSARKGVKYMYPIFKNLKNNNKNLIMILLFSGNVNKSLIKDVGDKDFIMVPNSEVKIEEYVAMADIGLFPYETLKGTEANPSCVFECMASNTPVVTSNLPEIREVTKNKVHLITAKPKDVKDFSNKISILLNNNDLYKKIQINGLKKSKEFDMETISKKYIDLFENIILNKKIKN